MSNEKKEEPVKDEKQEELEKAKRVLEEAEMAKRKEFAEKVEALCSEYGFDIKIQSSLVIVKR